MKTKNIILIIVLIAAGGWIIGQLNSNKRFSAVEREHEVWYCPMHPSILYDHPGRCPICGMDLVKRLTKVKTDAFAVSVGPMGQQANTPKGYATIFESAQRQQMIGLRTEKVELKPVLKVIRTFGTVSSDAQLYQIQTEFIDAYVNYVNVFRDYRRMRDRLHIWESHRDLQTGLVQAKDKLLKLGLSESEILKLQDVSWNQIWKQPKLLMFSGNRSYWVMAQIFEQDYSYVLEGGAVAVDIPALHEKAKGVIRSIGGFVDPASRSVTALIELKDIAGPMAANMQADITIPVNLGHGILVPRESVMDTGLHKIIFVCKDGTTFEPREIQTGMETDDSFEVKSGLKAGERIVVSGNFLLDSESRMQAVPQSDTASSQEGQPHES